MKKKLTFLVICFAICFLVNGVQAEEFCCDAYSDKIDEYATALSMDDEEFLEMEYDCSSINWLMLTYAHQYDEISLAYAYYDVDNNGIPELIFADGFNVIDIYTLKDGKIIKLYKECFFGERVRLYVLSQGYLMTEGANSASSSICEICMIDPETSELTDCLTAFYYDDCGLWEDREDAFSVDPYQYYAMVDDWVNNSVYAEIDWIYIGKE